MLCDVEIDDICDYDYIYNSSLQNSNIIECETQQDLDYSY